MFSALSLKIIGSLTKNLLKKSFALAPKLLSLSTKSRFQDSELDPEIPIIIPDQSQ